MYRWLFCVLLLLSCSVNAEGIWGANFPARCESLVKPENLAGFKVSAALSPNNDDSISHYTLVGKLFGYPAQSNFLCARGEAYMQSYSFEVASSTEVQAALETMKKRIPEGFAATDLDPKLKYYLMRTMMITLAYELPYTAPELDWDWGSLSQWKNGENYLVFVSMNYPGNKKTVSIIRGALPRS